MEKIDQSERDGVHESTFYDEDGDKLIVSTTYDPTDLIEENKVLRNQGRVTFGSKGQQLVLAARITEGDVVRLQNLGYNILSGDPQESHRALVYLRDHEQDFVIDKGVIADRPIKWA
jgi:hypothetical protein